MQESITELLKKRGDTWSDEDMRRVQTHLVQTKWREMLAVCVYRGLGNDAEDTVQDFVLSIHKWCVKFDSEMADFFRYAFGCLRRFAHQRMRRRLSRRELTDDGLREFAVSFDPVLVRSLEECFEGLKEQERSGLEMKTAGFTSEQVASGLEVTPVHARVIIHSGRRKLRACLDAKGVSLPHQGKTDGTA